ncbi:MAG: ABC transporter permease [Erysipelotrichaceae bacterium]|nr:ABC transporter permease [Erysipelotrichaceae bacterium]
MNKVKRLLSSLAYPLMAILTGLIIGAIIIMSTGKNPVAGIWGLLKGGYLTGFSLASTLTRATPIIFCGVSAALAWGSGYSSMGAQGQMIMGAITAAIVAPRLPGPDWLVVILTILCSMVAGALFSLCSAFVSAKFNAYLLIITLMFNYVANYFASYLTNYVFLDPYALDKLAIQTQKIEGSILPRILSKYTTHYGFVIALAVVILVNFLVKRTSFGYKARMGGLNPHFAEYGGIKSRKTMYMVLMISGAIAGLGGACEVLGTKFRYVDEMITSPGYSWSGITASLMSNYNMIGTLFSSIFLAGITVGGASIELTMNIPSEITQIIQGVISMLITAKIAIDWSKLNKRKESAE